MTKKRRTAKQLASDRRLGRLAKARAKKKRRRRSPAKRKVAKRRNPHRRVAKRPTRRKVAAKSHLWVVFRCYGKAVLFMGLDASLKPRFVSDKGKAALLKTKAAAQSIARKLSKKSGMAKYYIGAASSNTTTAEIRAHCAGKT